MRENEGHICGQVETPQCTEKPHHFGASRQANLNNLHLIFLSAKEAHYHFPFLGGKQLGIVNRVLNME